MTRHTIFILEDKAYRVARLLSDRLKDLERKDALLVYHSESSHELMLAHPCATAQPKGEANPAERSSAQGRHEAIDYLSLDGRRSFPLPSIAEQPRRRMAGKRR